jgi:hypothetical protein
MERVLDKPIVPELLKDTQLQLLYTLEPITVAFAEPDHSGVHQYTMFL